VLKKWHPWPHSLLAGMPPRHVNNWSALHVDLHILLLVHYKFSWFIWYFFLRYPRTSSQLDGQRNLTLEPYIYCMWVTRILFQFSFNFTRHSSLLCQIVKSISQSVSLYIFFITYHSSIDQQLNLSYLRRPGALAQPVSSNWIPVQSPDLNTLIQLFVCM
jgi:hypothetical protein